MAFANPSHPPALADGRATFAASAARPPKASLALSHTRTGDLTASLHAGSGAGLDSTYGKKQVLAAALEEQLVRKFGGSEALNAAIHREVASAVLGGERLTPEAMRALQDKVAGLALRESGCVAGVASPAATS